ncbi:SCP2 sterol-binding domain-containing protein [Maritimibacter sp. UBA3975]|uniref:SCP2 sterol-binding domain-containing protein n=1 Tax=Maritimibacter sp. UBA3975 TaxID=1946833 RepID=UPI000C09A77F|nr:SCP2 sterol-binding domain-containing protein [Maritimibacter sp. UBA3975]MAM63424.1 sterol carrier protein [Maritimibacter sp.]|tara:strand:- start:55127 stop:55414 length:288 start_codon:yes stop_codon:yes gene_type:complete
MSDLPEITARLNKALADNPLDQSIKFDCGDAGAITLSGDTAVLADEPADCTIRISEKNLVKLLTGKLNPMTAFAMGKIKVSGDMSVAMKLSQLVK